MNLNFKNPLVKSWTLLDDKIIVKDKEILLADIEKVELAVKGGRFTNGLIQITANQKIINLIYPAKSLEDGLTAFDYLEKNCNKQFKSIKKTRIDIENEMKDLPHVHEYYTRKEIAELPSLLEGEESIKAMTSGLTDGNTWLIVCTDKRVLMMDKGLIYGLKLIDIPLDRINSISHSKGLIMGKVAITDGATTRTIDNIPNATVAFFADTVSKEVEIYKQKKNAPIAREVQTISGADELMKYKELLDMGVLTQEEFEVKKKEILNL